MWLCGNSSPEYSLLNELLPGVFHNLTSASSASHLSTCANNAPTVPAMPLLVPTDPLLYHLNLNAIEKVLSNYSAPHFFYMYLLMTALFGPVDLWNPWEAEFNTQAICHFLLIINHYGQPF